jgi:hypothetical protein
MTDDNTRRPWLPLLFWIAVGGCGLLLLVPAAREWAHPSGQFSGLAVLALLAMAAVVATIAVAVAVIRKPWAYGIGSALVSLPLLWWALASLSDLHGRMSAPSLDDQAAGRGYFAAPADSALAEAIVAGDAARVGALAPTANLAAIGWGRMTFMRLALDAAHAAPAIIGPLLRAGLDPDQEASALYSLITSEKNEVLLRQVIDAGVDLNRHMGHGQWFLFLRYDWPEGLALLLDHGVDTEAQDAMGYTAIMRAVRVGSWPTVELLLAHGARTEHVGHDGKSLRHLLPEAIAHFRGRHSAGHRRPPGQT